MTKVIKLVDLPPHVSDGLEVARANLRARQRTITIDKVQGDIAIALTLLKELYDIDLANVHAKQGSDGVEYTFTATVRSKS